MTLNSAHTYALYVRSRSGIIDEARDLERITLVASGVEQYLARRLRLDFLPVDTSKTYTVPLSRTHWVVPVIGGLVTAVRASGAPQVSWRQVGRLLRFTGEVEDDGAGVMEVDVTASETPPPDLCLAACELFAKMWLAGDANVLQLGEVGVASQLTPNLRETINQLAGTYVPAVYLD